MNITNNMVAGLIIIYMFSNLLLVGAFLHKTNTTGLAGSAIGQVSLNVMPNGPCQINLQQDWNYISICQNTTNTNISEVLAGSSFKFVLEFDEQGQSYKVYSTLSNNNPFTNFNTSKSYFIWLENGSYLYAPAGTNYADVEIPLGMQWGTPFYPYELSGNTTTYLTTLDQNWSFMLKWNYSTQSFIIKSRLSNNPPFTNISAGEGQFLYMNQPAHLRYIRTDVLA